MSLNFTHDEVLERLRQIIGKCLMIDPESITEDSYLNDLGAESLDLVDISFSCEDEFNVLLPEKNIFEAGKAFFKEGTLQQDGFLTEEGKKLLKTRMPDFDISMNDGRVSMVEVDRSLLRVGAWVRMILGLLESTPKVCVEECDTPLVRGRPGYMKCPSCQREQEIRSGDSINNEWVQNYYEKEYLPNAVPSEAIRDAIQ